VYTVRHYWVRLRWSKRRPYSTARTVIRLAAIAVALAAVLDLLGIVSVHSLVHLFP